MNVVDHFKRFDEKLDKILDKIGSIDVTLGKQQVSLDEHIRRTELLEKAVEPMEHKWLITEGILKFSLKIGAGIVALVGIAEGIATVMEYLG